LPAGVAVRDERPQTTAEHRPQIAIERPDPVGDVHLTIVECEWMRLREFSVGCLGGGTGLPSLLGGLKSNPWVHADAVVTMFDSGGSSGVLRDELGVLPPGDGLKFLLLLSRDAAGAP